VEEGLAKTLGIQVGDTIAFDVAGNRFAAKVTNLRKVDWDSFKPNFFVISNPALLRSYPASWITSFHLGPGREDVIAGLVKRFPNVSVIDLTALMQQFQRITDQVSRAVEFVFIFAIAAGLVVLFAAITSTQDERVFEGAILRTLGASRRQMIILQLAEFLRRGFLQPFFRERQVAMLEICEAEVISGVRERGLGGSFAEVADGLLKIVLLQIHPSQVVHDVGMVSGYLAHLFQFPPRVGIVMHFKKRDSKRKARPQHQAGIERQRSPKLVCCHGIAVIFQGIIAPGHVSFRSVGTGGLCSAGRSGRCLLGECWRRDQQGQSQSC